MAGPPSGAMPEDIKTIDPMTPFFKQLRESAGPVTIIIIHHITSGKMEEAIKVWTKETSILRAQKGLLSVQLYQGISGSRLLTTVGVWESVGKLKTASFTDEFRAVIKEYPEGTLNYPHLYHKMAVEDLCTA